MQKTALTIEGTVFEFDVQQLALVEQNNPTNLILFSNMEYHETHYTINYDRDTKNLPDLVSNNAVAVRVPTMTELAPEAMAAKFGRNVTDIRNTSDLELTVPNYEAYLQRKAGLLPHIDINGKDFIIDWRLKELRLHDDPTARLSFHDFYRNTADDSFHFAYDTARGVVVNPHYPFANNHIVYVKIPDEMQLDPVGVAREYGLADHAMLREYPVVADLKARIIKPDDDRLFKKVVRREEKKRGRRM